nr:hypothetical protein [archaeon]
MSKTILKKTFATTIITILTLAIILAAIPMVYADTLTVGTGKTYATITEAIDVADDGDVIEVYAGTYTEDLSI